MLTYGNMIQKCMPLYLINVERYNATDIMIHNPNYIELMFTIEHVKQTIQIENLKVQ